MTKTKIMSQSLQHDDQSSDSDVTYCPEVEQSQKRLRKKPNFFQPHDSVRKLEQITGKIIKSRQTGEAQAAKLLRTLKCIKAKNLEEQNVIFQLTQKLDTCDIQNIRKRKLKSNDCDRNKNLNNIDQSASNEVASGSTHEPSQGLQHNYDLDPMIDFDISEEPQQTCDIDTNDILNCLNYEPTQDAQPNFIDHDAPQAFQDSCVSETLNLDHFDASQTNGILNNDTNFGGFQDPTGNFITEFDAAEKSNHNHENKAFHNSTFENFAQSQYSECNEITLHSDVKMIEPEPQEKQLMVEHLPPSCSNPTQTLQVENQTEEIKFSVKNERRSSRAAAKNKTRGKNNKNRATETQDNTQSTIQNVLSAENNSEKENKTMNWEEINDEELSAMSPAEKEKAIRLSLERAVEIMEVSKQKFKLRLLARKDEILKMRNSQASCSKEEASNACNFSGNSREDKLGFQADNSNVITKEELLQNMQALQEVSAYYKKKYKEEGIDILSD